MKTECSNTKQIDKTDARKISMRLGLLKTIFFLFFFPVIFYEEVQAANLIIYNPTIIPILTGPDTTCSGQEGYVYSTEQGMTNYVWTISPSSDGTITSGNGTHSITVTWNSPGQDTLTVTYDNASVSAVKYVTVLQTLPAGITISCSGNPVCAGTPVTFTAALTNGGSSPFYRWKVDRMNLGTSDPIFTYTPANGDTVCCVLTSSLPCSIGNPATSNQIIMTVNPNLPVSISISASVNPVCNGTLVTFTATPVNGGSSPAYQWKVNGGNAGTNQNIYSYIPTNGDVVTCILTSNAICPSGNPTTSNPVTMIVSPDQPVSVSISASANPACMGNPVTFTATPVNGGSSPVYEWKINGTDPGWSSGPTITYTPDNGDTIICKLTSNAPCATGNPAISNTIVMIVSAYAPVSVNISASSNPVCAGIPVIFTATPTNGGPNPAYLWKVNGINTGTDSPTFIYPPNNGDIVNCVLTSNVSCPTGNPATSNSIIITVSPNLPASVSIIASANPACQGTPVLFTAYPVNGGTSPSFQWIKNGINVGINSPFYTYIPANGDTVKCRMTSNDPCNMSILVMSNTIHMIVSPGLPVGVSITASANPVCQGSPVTFTATPTNGGSTPSYKWKVGSDSVGTNSPVYIYTPGNGDVVTCQLTSVLICTTGNPATSNAITMIVSSSLPVSITITASPNPSCSGQTVIFTATAINGGTNPSYQWTVNGINLPPDDTVFSYIPANGDCILCHLVSSYSCATGNPAVSNQICMTVNPYLPVSVSIVSSQNASCQGSAVTYTATPVNGGSSPGYFWKVNNVHMGSDQSTFTYVPANGDIITCQLTSNIPCPIANPVTSNSIIQIVNPIVAAGIYITSSAVPPVVCTGTSVTFFAYPTYGGSAPFYQWKINGVNAGLMNVSVLTYIPNNGDIITCTLTSSLMCVSGNPVLSNSITMVVSSSLTASISIFASANPFCQGTQVTFTAFSANGGTNPTYQWKKNGFDTGTSSTTFHCFPVNGDYITCMMTSSLWCATPNPVTSSPIILSVNTVTHASVTITASENPVCQGSPVTFTATPVNGGTSPIYQWKVNGINEGTNSTYNYNPVNGDIVTCSLTSNALCAYGNPAISNPDTMVVSTSLPASIIITTLTNPFCQGSSVTFTASGTNKGSSPIYHWKVNGVNTGPNSPTFIYFPVNGDNITCALTSNATCISGTNPVLSNTITMIASTALPVSVAIAASANPVCQLTPVTYTATPINGGSTPVYQWKVGTTDQGINSPVFTYTPVNGNVVTCHLTSSLSCATGNPATSNAIMMIVTPPVPVSVSITASNNPVCLGVTETFTATPVNGGLTPIYIWRVNGIIVDGNSPTYSYIPLNGDIVTCELISNQTCVSWNPAISNQILIVVRTEQPVSVVITASSNPFCAGSYVTFIAHPTNGGTEPIYCWWVNGIQKLEGAYEIYTYQPLAGDMITCQLTSNQACICNNPATSNTIIMLAGSGLPVSVSITVSANPVCAGTTLVAFTAIPANGGPFPSYQWQVDGANIEPPTSNNTYQYYPLNGNVVTCILTSSLSCATGNPAISNAITMTVYPSAPVSITITASSNPCCQGSAVTFTATPTNGGSNPVFQWYVNEINKGENSPTYTYQPINGDIVKCRLFSNATCLTGNPAYSTAITMIVNPYLSVGVSITSSANPVCQSTTVIFTATPFNGGLSPAYQWKVNGINTGTNSSAFSYNPVNGDVVTCDMTSSELCVLVPTVTSNSLLMTVSPYTPVSVHIAASANPVCLGAPVTFNATPTHGGITPSYQWKVNRSNAGTNNQTFTYNPNNDDTVTCILTSNTSCPTGNPATSNAIIMIVNNSLPVSVSIMASSNPACQGQTITYSATAINGGPNPTYQWMVNGVGVGTNNPVFSFTPVTGDVVTCELTSDLTCTTGNPAMSNPIAVIFFPNVSVSVSITCSANPACLGNQVTYTAISVNGGSSPAYQWKVNGINVDTNMSTYTYIPFNGDIISCQLTSNAPCPINNPVTSNTITMMVQTPALPGISITASANPVCLGTTVTYTAITINGGSTPGYKWNVDGICIDSLHSSYSDIPHNGEVITCQLNSSLSCVSGNPAVSYPVSMVVSTDFPVNVSITVPSDTVCMGQPATFTATQVNGGINPFYQWKVGGMNVGTDNPVYSYIPTNGDCITCTLTSGYSCATGNPAVSNPICMTVKPYLPASVSITCSMNPACTGTPVTFSATPTNEGSAPAYQWKVNGQIAGSNSGSYTYSPVNGDVVGCVLTSSLACVSGSPAISNQITMTIGSAFPVSVSISGTNPICEATPVLFTATPTYGGSFPYPYYQWKKNGVDTGANSQSFLCYPRQGDSITCVMTSNLSCGTGNPATSNTIKMIVLPVPVSVTIDANPTGPVCAGDWVTFTAHPVNGGANPTFMWRVRGIPEGTNSSTFSYQPANGDTIKCVLTSNATCATGNTATSNLIVMTVNPLQPVSVSILTSATTVCDGTLVTYTTTPVNGGSSPSYQWKVNTTDTGTNSPVFSYIPANSDIITCVLTSNITCPSGNPATSNAITMTVNPNLPVSVAITATPSGVLCEGTPVCFTATAVNGGSNPGYQWKLNGVNAGTNDTVFCYTPSNGDTITCILTSTAICPTGNPATSNTIIMTVNPILPVSIAISASPSDTICAGILVTLTATPTNGSSTPSFQWKVNGINAGTNSPTYSFTPTGGDVVICILTSNAPCTTGNPATSNMITMTVNPLLPASVSISASPSGAICAGTSVTFTAYPTNGGTPAYQWYRNGISITGETGSTYTSTTLVTGDQITVEMTSTATCSTGSPATSNMITMTVNPILAVSVLLVADANPVCAGTTVNFTANPTNGGVSPVYAWYKNSNLLPLETGPIYSYIATTDDQVYVIMTSSETCKSGSPATSNTVIMTVNPILVVSVLLVADANPVCAGTTVNFTATPTNGGVSPVYAWYKNSNLLPLETGPIYSYVPTTGDQVYVIMTSSETCKSGSPATSNTVIMTVNSILAVSVLLVADANPVCAGTTVNFTATPTNGGVSPVYVWYKNSNLLPLETGPIYSYVPTTGDQVYVIMTSSETCKSGSPDTSNTVIMTVNPILAVSVLLVADANPVCAGTTVNFTATPTNGGVSPVYAWYKNTNLLPLETGPIYSYVPTTGDQVYVIMTSSETCKSGSPATSNTVIMTVNPILAVSVLLVADANPVCAGTTVNFTATPTNGGVSPVYAWYKNSNLLPLETGPIYSYVPTTSDQVYVIMTSSETCKSGSPATSNTIIMTVNPLLPVSITVTASPSDTVYEGTLVCFTATPVNGGSGPVYQWKVNGINAGNNSPSYCYTPLNGDIVTCLLTSNAICPTGNPAISNVITMIVHPFLPVSVTIVAVPSGAVCAGMTVCFNATPVNGGSSPVYHWKINGIITGTNSPSYCYPPLNGDTITCVLTSNAPYTTGNPATSNAIIMTVNPNLPLSITISAVPSGAVCAGTQVCFTATPVNGGSIPSYQWKVNGIDKVTNNPMFCYTPFNGDIITCVLTSNATCATGNPATSNAITMTVNPLMPVNVTITPNPSGAFCAGTPVVYIATPVNGGSIPSYQWKVNGENRGTDNPVFTYAPQNNDVVKCILTSNITCPVDNPATSNSLVMSVFANPYVLLNMCLRLTSRDGKPIFLRGGIPAGGIYSGQGVSNGLFYPNLIPVSQDSAMITYTNTSANGCISSGNQYIVVKPSQPFICGNNFIDIRDNKSYPTVFVGSQCWFAKNLDYGQFVTAGQDQRDNCIIEKYCYSDNLLNCDTLGGLYQWDEMMQYNNLETAQGFCPPEWHIPSENEWNLLFDFFNTNAHAGDSLKMGGGSGFHALLSGGRFNNRNWNFKGFSGFFWSSTPDGVLKGWAHGINAINHGVSSYPSYRSNAFSIRCIKD